jgi:trehalose utilization protein
MIRVARTPANQPRKPGVPVYHHRQIQRVLANDVKWAAQPAQHRAAPDVTNPARAWFTQG